MKIIRRERVKRSSIYRWLGLMMLCVVLYAGMVSVVLPADDGQMIKGRFVDECNDTSLVYINSGVFYIADWAALICNNDPGSFCKWKDEGGYLIYKALPSADLTGFEIDAYRNKEYGPEFKFYISSDNQTYVEVPVSIEDLGIGRDKFFHLIYRNVDPFPAGTLYLKLEFPEHTIAKSCWSNLIARVMIDYYLVNHAPETDNTFIAVTTVEDTPMQGKVAARDVDYDPIQYTISTAPAHGNATITTRGGKWVYTPAKDFYGQDSFRVTVADPKGGEVEVTIELTVTPVNDPPVLNNFVVKTLRNKPVTSAGGAVDPDGDNLTYRLTKPAKRGKVTLASDGAWTYTPADGYLGKEVFEIGVDDGQGENVTGSVSILVHSIPSVSDYQAKTREETVVRGKVKAKDADGDPLTYTKGSDPRYGEVSVGKDGRWIYTPQSNYTGSDQFTVAVTDPSGQAVLSRVSINITPVNDPPMVDEYTITAVPGKTIAGVLLASDVERDTLTYRKETEPLHGMVTIQDNGAWSYKPGASFKGTDQFKVRVSDGQSAVVTTVYLTDKVIFTMEATIDPSTRLLAVSGRESTGEIVTLTVKDSHGNLVGIDQLISDEQGNYEYSLSIKGLQPGVYQVTAGCADSNVMLVAMVEVNG